MSLPHFLHLLAILNKCIFGDLAIIHAHLTKLFENAATHILATQQHEVVLQYKFDIESPDKNNYHEELQYSNHTDEYLDTASKQFILSNFWLKCRDGSKLKYTSKKIERK